jgi:AraC family L-rhamnose operon regulatory protein RhaS
MEKLTIDNKRGFTLSAYFELKEEFKEQSRTMLKLVYVMEGNGILEINSQPVIFSAPAIFCFNEHDKVVLKQSVNLEAQAVYFDPAIIDESLQLHILRGENTQLSETEYRDYFLIIPFMEREEFKIPCIEIGLITSKRVAYLFKGMREELTGTENEYWPCRSRSYLLEMLFLIQNIITDTKNRENIELPKITEDASDIILYLHANYDKKITIEELTEIFHVNRTTLSQKFKSATGISIIEYLVKLRIKIAAVMLRDTLLPISEILDRVGFYDSVHFLRMFKKHMNCTPSEYRKIHSVLENGGEFD